MDLAGKFDLTFGLQVALAGAALALVGAVVFGAI